MNARLSLLFVQSYKDIILDKYSEYMLSMVT
jgi:hypothetical protein